LDADQKGYFDSNKDLHLEFDLERISR